jgi:hypothetical protein
MKRQLRWWLPALWLAVAAGMIVTRRYQLAVLYLIVGVVWTAAWTRHRRPKPPASDEPESQ